MNSSRRLPAMDPQKYRKYRETGNITSSQESLNSNGFHVSNHSLSTDSANENDLDRSLVGKMTNVPVIRESDEMVNHTPQQQNNGTEQQPEQQQHNSSLSLSTANATSSRESPTHSDEKRTDTLVPKRNSAERKSDRSSSEYHETSPDKLDGSGDKSDNCHGNVSLPVPPYDGKSVSSLGSVDGAFDRSLDSLMVRLGDKPGDRTTDLHTSQDISYKSSFAESGSKSGTELDGKKKKKSWYTVLNPTYKSRMMEFRKLFKDVPREERLIVDYSCAYQKDILVQGRMYLTQNWICFYANIFTWETVLTIPCKDVVAVTKEKTARVIPNAIQVSTDKDKMFFTSFTSRDKAFLMLFRVWQNTLLDQKMTSKELWHWVHYSYGEELGLTESDGDIAVPSGLDDSRDKGHERTRRRRGSKKHEADKSEVSTHCNDSILSNDLSLLSPHSSTASLDTGITSGVGGAVLDGESSGADSPGEVVCSNHDHLDKVYLNDTFDIPVDKVFEFLFSDSKFFRDFCASRKTFNLSLPDWQPEPNADGDREREIRYTLTLSASIGPKHSPSYEKQIYHAESQPGFIYVVDAHCYNGGIPYADTFYVTNRYCLTRVTHDSCRVRVSSELRYTKSIWSLVKNMIVKNAHHGLTAYFQQLESHLRRESQKYEEMSPRIGAKKHGRRRRKVTDHSSGETDRLASEPASPSRGIRTEGAFGISAENLVRLLCVVLVLLFVFNAVLFYKLFYLEGVTNSLYYTSITDNMDQYTRTQSPEEWMTLLKRQQQLHQMEVDKWRDVLGGAVHVLDQIKATLAGLQAVLNQRKTDSTPNPSPSHNTPRDET